MVRYPIVLLLSILVLASASQVIGQVPEAAVTAHSPQMVMYVGQEYQVQFSLSNVGAADADALGFLDVSFRSVTNETPPAASISTRRPRAPPSVKSYNPAIIPISLLRSSVCKTTSDIFTSTVVVSLNQ